MKRLAITSLALTIAPPVWAQQTPDPMAAVQSEAGDPHAGHGMAVMPPESGAEIGGAPAPAPPEDHAADTIFDPAEMARSRSALRHEHGAFSGSMILFDRAEYRVRKGGDGYRWVGEAWFGGDIDRLLIKTEGEATFGEPIESAEAQMLFSRAISPYWNAHAGVRYAFRPDPSRPYAVIGVEGVAPYWFRISGQLLLSDQGDFLVRAEANYDQRITQSLILTPSAELNLSAQDRPQIGVGPGITDVELGLRLRYEVQHEFAPYVGIAWSKKLGVTGRYAQARDDESGATGLVAGIRFWF